MKRRMLMVAVVMAAAFFTAGILHAANGDLVVNGNLGVGTPTPAAKAEINGNMIVDGNLGVGTTTPSAKAEINGNVKVNGTITNNGETVTGTVTSKGQTVNGNVSVTGNATVNGTVNGQSGLCVGSDCTTTLHGLHASGGLYGYCSQGTSSACSAKSPASCGLVYGYTTCLCPSDYTLVRTGSLEGGSTYTTTTLTYFSCYKN